MIQSSSKRPPQVLAIQLIISVLVTPKFGVVRLPVRDLRVDARLNRPDAPDEEVCPGEDLMMG